MSAECVVCHVNFEPIGDEETCREECASVRNTALLAQARAARDEIEQKAKQEAITSKLREQQAREKRRAYYLKRKEERVVLVRENFLQWWLKPPKP